MTGPLSVKLLTLLFGASLVAGLVDAIAGGGGLITVPVLLLSQIPPLQALATNKIQGTIGAFTAASLMVRHRVVEPRAQFGPAAGAGLGAAMGSLTVPLLPSHGLDIVIPMILIGIALYFAFVPLASAVERKARIGPRLFGWIVVPLIGFYDGFLGPGTGSFLALGGVALRGQDLLRATGTAKLLNFASNAGSAVVWIVAGKVLWIAAAVMMLGQLLGALIGTRLVISNGPRLIRPVIVVVCLAMTVRYLVQKEILAL